MSSIRNCSLVILLICLWVASATTGAGLTPEVVYIDGHLRVEAKDVLLADLLQAISEKTDVTIYLAEELRSVRITVQVDAADLESGFKSILRGFNQAMIFRTDDQDTKVMGLKVYPVGKFSGTFAEISRGGMRVPSATAGTLETVDSKTREIVSFRTAYYPAERSGLLVPTPVTKAQGDPKLSLLRLKMEQQERQAYEELMHLRRRVEAASDPDKKLALDLAYADRLAAFETLKNRNRNKLESLERALKAQQMQKKP